MSANALSPSLIRRSGKILYFLSQGCGPAKASWLARRDAVKRFDYRQATLPVLETAYACDPSWRDIEVSRDTVRSKRLPLPFLPNDLLATDYGTACALVESGFNLTRDGITLLARKGDLVLRFATPEQLSMAREIYIDRCYALAMQHRHVVIDIGANVGFASLYFASQPWVSKVVSFEPFPGTFKQNQAIRDLNPGLCQKITCHNLGLSDRKESMIVEYDPEFAGSMSTSGLGAWRAQGSARRDTTTIQVERASEWIKAIADDAGDCPLVVKMDCEGSEFAILRDLEATGMLNALSAITLEWHNGQPDELLQRLARAKFNIQERPLRADRTFGLILAWRDGPREKRI